MSRRPSENRTTWHRVSSLASIVCSCHVFKTQCVLRLAIDVLYYAILALVGDEIRYIQRHYRGRDTRKHVYSVTPRTLSRSRCHIRR